MLLETEKPNLIILLLNISAYLDLLKFDLIIEQIDFIKLDFKCLAKGNIIQIMLLLCFLLVWCHPFGRKV
uniref:Uncharacterized protein n=1 Tax=Octopus bimaculoides TaxID=37653 RepID=A0A0L8H0B5_OCTBM